jgi:hypothetical protein
MLIYICSRYRANTSEEFERLLSYTKEKAKEQVELGNDVIVPHLYYPRFLDDNNEHERNIGIKSAISLMKYCDIILVCIKYGISEGMLAEIKEADIYKLREII